MCDTAEPGSAVGGRDCNDDVDDVISKQRRPGADPGGYEVDSVMHYTSWLRECSPHINADGELRILPPANAAWNVLVVSDCLSVGLIILRLIYFRRPWPRNFISGMYVSSESSGEFVYQGHRVKVKVTWYFMSAVSRRVVCCYWYVHGWFVLDY